MELPGQAGRERLPEPEVRLYELLRREHGDDPHGRYNALVRSATAIDPASFRGRAQDVLG